MKTENENELIAEFMGVKMRHMGPVDYLCDDYGNVDFTDDPTVYQPHKNWNQFMPVVAKVNTLFDEDGLQGLDVDVFRSMQDWVASVNIQNAYADLVNIIKWYNENKQP